MSSTTAASALVCTSLFILFLLAMIPGNLVNGIRESVGSAVFDPILSVLLAISLLATGFAAVSRSLESSKEIAFISMIVALASAGRVLFAAAPNVSPVDWLTLCTGMVFGPVTGFTVGASSMLVSNFYLGQGPWTFYQMVGMGFLGLLGGFLGRSGIKVGRKTLAGIGFGWGLAYGVITSFFWVLMISSVLNWASFSAYLLSGMPFFLLQGVGNALLLLLLGEKTLLVFERHRRRLRVVYTDAEGGEVPA
jgi:energy-coupling factor transport system substrate-specific component